MRPLRRRPKQLTEQPSTYEPAPGGAGLALSSGDRRRQRARVQGGGSAFTVLLTAALLVSIPTALLFGLTQKYFQRGLALGQY